jgi:uncharacterized protein with HEPN domain
MPPDDEAPLRHLIDAAEKAVSFVEGKERVVLDQDEVLRLALTKLVEIVGEAAKQVSEPVRAAYPAVPWAAAARMRDLIGASLLRHQPRRVVVNPHRGPASASRRRSTPGMTTATAVAATAAAATSAPVAQFVDCLTR